MAKRMAESFNEDDYFAEPNYDLLTDDELDELYNFGEIRSQSRRKRGVKTQSRRATVHALDFDGDDDWLDVDLDSETELSFDD